MVCKSQDPVVVGLGLAAVRDFISFLKYGSPGVRQPDPGGDWSRLQRAIAFGSSQSGRFLRTYLYQGFNEDERNRQVFDGIWSHVGGGGRGSFNHRFAQPSRDARPFFNFFYPTDIFPFADVEQTDPETGRTDGLLTRARKSNTIPRIFNTNSSVPVPTAGRHRSFTRRSMGAATWRRIRKRASTQSPADRMGRVDFLPERTARRTRPMRTTTHGR